MQGCPRRCTGSCSSLSILKRLWAQNSAFWR